MEDTMIDKKLIAMADTPEIQERWEPKLGDRVWINTFEILATVVTIDIKEPEVIRVVSLERVMLVLPVDCVYIPRIEEVLELLVPKHYKSWGKVRWNVRWWDSSIGWTYFNTMLKGALDTYMHLEHNKNWTGEKWV
jgi:hypothetical protein